MRFIFNPATKNLETIDNVTGPDVTLGDKFKLTENKPDIGQEDWMYELDWEGHPSKKPVFPFRSIPKDWKERAKNTVLTAELDNVNTPDLEQSPDSFLRPGETLEDWDVSFRRPNAHGGLQRQPFAPENEIRMAGRRVLGNPIKIDGKEYKKVLEGPDKGKYAIKQGTNNPRQFVKKSEIRKTVASNFKIGREHLTEMYEERSRLHKLSTNNRNKWIKNWVKNNINKYGVREFDNFQTDLLNYFNKELKNNPKKYPEWQGTVRVSDNLPIIGDPYGKNTIVIDDINFPRYDQSEGRTQKHAYKKLFYKNKLKDKNFKAKVNSYLDWNLTRKLEGGAGSMTKTAALDYGKLAKGFDEDVVHFMGEVLNERPLNPGGGQKGIHDIFRDALGKKANAYFKKYQGSWGRWVNNFYDVAKLAGLNETQAKALMQKQINDTQKIMKVYNVKKLPLEFMVAQDHIMGLAEAKHLGDPKIAAQTLRNLVASTREQNRYLGQQGFSTKRKSLINKFKKAPPNARGPIVNKINALAEEFVPGRLRYDVRKDGSLKITNLQPETTLKAKKVAYEKLSKEFPKNIQKAHRKIYCSK